MYSSELPVLVSSNLVAILDCDTKVHQKLILCLCAANLDFFYMRGSRGGGQRFRTPVRTPLFEKSQSYRVFLVILVCIP